MSKKLSAQECFDQVMTELGTLTQPSTATSDEEAVARLRQLASDARSAGLPERAAQIIEDMASFPGLQKDWASKGKQDFAVLVNAELPRLREALGMGRTNLADTIWKTAELLRGAFKEAEYRKVVLPFTILRRLDCLLEPTKKAVAAKHKEISAKKYEPSLFLPSVSGYPFWNHSPFTIKDLLEAPDEIRDNLEAMVNGFSPNVKTIFDRFGFMATVDKLVEKGRLLHVARAFARVPMDMYSVSSHDMGKAFEELLRRFNDASPAGEQYTPRDAIHLMVDILLDGDDEALSVPGAIRTVYDQTAGTGGMLSEAEEKIKALNPEATVRLFGQELEDETYAICMSDMLIRGQNPADIAPGDTLADDKHPDGRFDYQLSNPPYGVEWKPAEDKVKREHARGAAGRFAPGLPRISDGQMLFMLNALSKMQPYIDGKGGGRIGLVHNGSPLFVGDAGSGESEIRRYILENDFLDAIVALPTDMFYNTNIATYLWFMSNCKPEERKDKVMLIDATNMGVVMKKNLGKKRFELSEDCQRRIVETYHDFQDMEWSDIETVSGRRRALKAKVLPTSHFFYRKVTIERPLRMRFDLDSERLQVFGQDASCKKLSDGGELFAALNQVLEAQGPQVYMDADSFRAAIQNADDANAKAAKVKSKKLKAKQLEVARKFFGVKDKKAEITTDDKGIKIADSELRDAEYIPFERIGNDVPGDIAEHFASEVLPHWTDAWIAENVRDHRDGQVGAVGCELSFNREFYKYQAPRGAVEIKREIEQMENAFMKLLSGVTS
jgi:type I restriction enzyme M protein